jgi:Methyltransferase FkbM domain
MSSRSITTLDGLKIDVQGHEEQVLRGAQATLKRGLQWIWIEFSPDHLRGAGTDPERFLKHLGHLGMDIFEIGEMGTRKHCRGSKVTHRESALDIPILYCWRGINE